MSGKGSAGAGSAEAARYRICGPACDLGVGVPGAGTRMRYSMNPVLRSRMASSSLNDTEDVIVGTWKGNGGIGYFSTPTRRGMLAALLVDRVLFDVLIRICRQIWEISLGLGAVLYLFVENKRVDLSRFMWFDVVMQPALLGNLRTDNL